MKPEDINEDVVLVWRAIIALLPSLIEKTIKEREVSAELFGKIWGQSDVPAEVAEATTEEQDGHIIRAISPIIHAILRIKYQEVLLHKLLIEELESSSEERQGLVSMVEKTLLLNLVKNNVLTVEEAKGMFHNTDLEDILKTSVMTNSEELKGAVKSVEQYFEQKKKADAL